MTANQSVRSRAQEATEHVAPAAPGSATPARANEARSDELCKLSYPRDGDVPGDCSPLTTLGQVGRSFDRSLNFITSQVTLGLAPAALAETYFDWLVHLASAPGKQAELAAEWWFNRLQLFHDLVGCPTAQASGGQCGAALPPDKRFAAPEWSEFPFNLIQRAFIREEQWWDNATRNVHGMTLEHRRKVGFAARQLLDTLAPSNFVLTNPVVLKKTIEESGTNLVRGALNLADDVTRSLSGQPPAGIEGFEVGKNIAATPGKVVFRNRLIELIQYEPTTARVRPEPVLIVPAWIMKYYVLDLSRENSLVGYLRDQGFTVFMVSWKNPDSNDRDLGLEDYRQLGVMAAIQAVNRIVPGMPVHGVGYCLGGTLLAIAAAAMARGDVAANGERLKTLSLFAAQVDFTEAGELTLFINESQVAFLEDVMHEQGYLASQQMAGAFQILRSNDLIWSRLVRDYLMGGRSTASDLMAWNADATRMPARMHAEYLRHLFIDNDLAEGRYRVFGKPVALTDIRAPIFAVGTETDHIAPWKSVYKIHLFADTEVTFALTTGGHNAGIVSAPSHTHRSYRVATRTATDTYVDPASWVEQAPLQQGSWWPAWVAWLAERSGAQTASPPSPGTAGRAGTALCNAPGTYVFAH